MRVSVITPDATFFDGEAAGVTLEASDGSLGILPGHAPLIAALGHGVTEVDDGKDTHRVAVYGGFVKVQDDVVTVLARGAQKGGEDDEAEGARQAAVAADEALRAARESGASPVELRDLEEQAKRARAYLDLF